MTTEITFTWKFTNIVGYATFNGITNVPYSYHYEVTATNGISSSKLIQQVRLKVDETTAFSLDTATEEQFIEITQANIDWPKISSSLKEKLIAAGAEGIKLRAPWEPSP